MSRRPGNEELEFGSDSFLDIIVGILIILIVVAGVKVARQPPEVPEAVALVEVSMPAPTVDRTLLIRQQQLDALRRESGRLRGESERLCAQQVVFEQNAADLTSRAAGILASIDTLRSIRANDRKGFEKSQHHLTSITEQTRHVNAQISKLTLEIDDADHAKVQMTRAVEEMVRYQTKASDELDDIKYETMRLKEVLDRVPPPEVSEPDRLMHRLSPVARSTSNQEIHFRLSEGRIAWVPLQPLLEQLRDQVRSRVAVINRFGRYEGVVGPTNGFLMKYTVERQPDNPLQSLSGRRSFSVGVSRWTVRPSDTLSAESVERALQIGSQFRQVLEAADPEATVTVWLYARDFASFRPLREFAHSLGLRVAGRPLPDDAEITGSPAGSKSSAQ